MPELDIVDTENKKVGKVEASSNVFEARVRDELVQRYVTMQLAARRGGNAATKQNKGELHGSNAKPWRQKGTGRARSGNTRSPVWRGGMTVFGPSPRSYAFSLSKKSKKLQSNLFSPKDTRVKISLLLTPLSSSSQKPKM